MSRAGRPRKAGVIREPNGQASRRIEHTRTEHSPTAIKRLADAAIAGMAAPEWGSALGLAYLRSYVTAGEYAAGKQYAELHRRYLSAIGAQSPSPKPATLERAETGSTVDFDTEAGHTLLEKDARSIRAYEAATTALAKCGVEAQALTLAYVVAIGDRSVSLCEMRQIRRGLEALRVHFYAGKRGH